MTPTPDDTRARLLEAAGQVFADVGFQAATVRDICERAGTNVAAVNYHFRDKLTLYLEVFRSSLLQAENEALDEAMRATGADEQLRRFLHVFLHRLLGDGRPSWWTKLMAREMAQPTAALERVVDAAVRPNERRLQAIVAGLLQRPDDDRLVRLCAHSVIAQCLHYKHAMPVLTYLWPEMVAMPSARIDELAEHITRFSLAALRGLAEDNP